jgi:hypothetical protein
LITGWAQNRPDLAAFCTELAIMARPSAARSRGGYGGGIAVIDGLGTWGPHMASMSRFR